MPNRLRIRPQRRPRYYGGSNKFGRIVSSEEITDGVFRYQVSVKHAPSGANMILKNVAESVNTFYEDEAGSFAVDEYVVIQRESRGLWTIVKKVPNPKKFPNPESVINVGSGIQTVSDTYVRTQFDKLYIQQGRDRIEISGPDIMQSFTEKTMRIENDESVMVLRDDGPFEMRLNAPTENKKFYVLGYPEDDLLAIGKENRDQFVLVTEGSEVYSTASGGVPSHDHDIPPHTHILELRPINALTTLQSDTNGLFFDAYDGTEPTIPMPSFTYGYTVSVRRAIFSFFIGNPIRREIDIQSYDPDEYTYHREKVRWTLINNKPFIDYVITGRTINNLWVSDGVQVEGIETEDASVVGSVATLGAIRSRPSVNNRVDYGNYNAATLGIVSDTVVGNRVDINYEADESADAIIPHDWIPNLALRGGSGERNIPPSANNISSIILYGVRVRLQHNDIPKLVSPWAYRMGMEVIPADGYTF